MKNDETRYHVKKLKIRPNSKQKEQIEGILNELTLYFNAYLYFCKLVYDEVRPKGFDYLGYFKDHESELIMKTNQFMLDTYGLKWIITKNGTICDDLVKRVRKDIMHGCKMYRNDIVRGMPMFKDRLKGQFVKSIWFANSHRNSGRFDIKIHDKDHPNRIKLNYVGWLYLFNYKYLNDIESKNIKSVRIKKEVDDSYSVCILVDFQKELITDDELSDGIGIDLGVRKYVTIEGKVSFTYPNPYEMIPRLKYLRNKEKEYHSILDKKKDKIFAIHSDLEVPEVYAIIRSSRKMQDLYRKRRKILYKISCIMDNYMKRLAKFIIGKFSPEFICIEDFRVQPMRKFTGHENMERIYNCKFASFIKILKNVCHEAGVEVRVAKEFDNSSKRCHCCGNVRENFSNQEYYRCINPDCEMYNIKIDRDKNAALNLYQMTKKEYTLIKEI